jgi:signal transduction histidine kinase/CheY-like chemotaxis protein
MVDRRIQESLVARFNLVCGNLPWTLFGASLVAFALAFVLIEQLPFWFCLSWVLLVQLLIVTRAWYLRIWHNQPTSVSNVKQRLRTATLLSTLTASLFGAITYLGISNEHLLVNLLVIMLLTGMVAGASAAFSHILSMYLLYILPLMLPVAVRLYGFGEFYYLLMAGLVFVYIPISLGISRNIGNSITRSIDLRFDNLELVDNLRHEQTRAQQALAKEEKASHAKSKFLAAASHDLRQPLHSLRLFTTTLDLQTRDDQQKQLISQIDQSVRSLEELFNILLDISKLDAGTVIPDRRHVQLDAVLSELKDEFAAIAVEKRLAFNVALHGHVIFSDGILFEKLIRNLLVNAFRYTFTGNVSVESLQVDEGDRVSICIADTGVGIPESEHSRIFEEFVQLDNTERDRNRGLGLGLPIVKRLCDLLDIDLQLESVVGSGTRITLSVPPGERLQPDKVTPIEGLTSGHVSSLFVLVIDDDQAACLAMEMLLETWGCVVMSAGSGDEAVRQLGEIGEIPDVIISDYRLRNDETGGAVVNRIRKVLKTRIPAIIITGDIARERLVEISNLGFPALHKPCEPEKLRQMLAEQTQQKNTLVEYS